VRPPRIRPFAVTIAIGFCIAAAGLYAQSPIPAFKRGETFTARVTSVPDGDTVTVATAAESSLRIRVEGVDCPESGQPFSQVARNFTRQLVFDRTVTVRVLDVDRYGRLVSRVIAGNHDLSLELVKAGLAWHYTAYSADRLLESAELDARRAKRGLWSQPNPAPPWVGRRPEMAAGSTPLPQVGPFRANVRSGVFHKADCKNAHCQNCTRTFERREEAEAAGFRPAGDCLKRESIAQLPAFIGRSLCPFPFSPSPIP
jgi:endonuclease YncB( thermonuclease family)